MGYLFILLFSLLNLGEGIVVKEYAKKHGNGGMIMNAIIAFFSTRFFVVTDKNGFIIPDGMLPIALINVAMFALGFYFTFVAYQCGPFGLSRLISSFSQLFTIFYGILFLNEEAGIMTYVGVALIFVAIALINFEKQNENDEKQDKGISLKWILCISVSTVANGFIGILTRYQQIKFDNSCSNEFQAVSIGGAFIALMAIGIISERKNLSCVMKNGLLYGLGAGIMNGGKNFLTLLIYLSLPLSIVSPMNTGLGILLTFAAAFIIYKEKYSFWV